MQPAKTESASNAIRLLSAETKCPPKVSIYPHSAPKPKPKPKSGRPLPDTIKTVFDMIWKIHELVQSVTKFRITNFKRNSRCTVFPSTRPTGFTWWALQKIRFKVNHQTASPIPTQTSQSG